MSGIITGPDISAELAPGNAIGLTKTTKDRPRVDFTARSFTNFLEQHGTRIAWSRSAVCPCTPINGQTRQPNINCTLCKDNPGFMYFREDGYNTASVPEIGDLDTIQQYLVDRTATPAVVIQGAAQKISLSQTPYDKVGDWVDGMVSISFRPENRIGYYDRLTFLDGVLDYSEIVLTAAPDSPTVLRFPAIRVDFVRSETQLYKHQEDYLVDSIGRICFVSGRGPAKGTRISVKYLHRPQYIVWDHLHAIRVTKKNTKLGENPKTPLGNIQHLPSQVQAKLEFLIGGGGSQGND